MKRWLGWSIVILVFLLGTAGTVLSTTQWGLQWTMSQVAGLVPGELRIKTLHGRLIGPIHAEGVEYRQPGKRTTSIQSIDLDWHPLSLLNGTLNISSIEIAGVHYAPLAGAPAAQGHGGLPDITLPIKIRLQKAALKQLTIEQPNSAPVRIAEITLTTSTDEHGIHISDLNVAAPALDLSLHGTVQPRGDYPMKWHADWAAHPPGMTAVAGTLNISGTLKSLTLSQRIERPFRADINGSITNIMKNPAWRAHIAVRQLRTDVLKAGLPAAAITGNIDLVGDFSSVTARGEASVTGNAFPVTGHFDVSYKDSTLNIAEVKVTTPAAPTVLSASGRITHLNSAPDLDIKGTWRQLRWPLKAAGVPALISSAGDFHARGGLDDYQVTLDAPVVGARVPPGVWQLAAQGNRSGLRLTDAHIKTLDGELSGQGSLTWRPHLSWKFNVSGTDLNPGSYWTDFPGRLAFSASTTGGMESHGVQARIAVDRLDGRIRGYPVQGGTLITYTNAGLDIRRLSLSSDKTRVTASGTIGKVWDVRWRAVSPALETLLPNARGTLNAEGGISGESQSLRAKASLDAKQLAYDRYQADRLQVRADVDIAAATGFQRDCYHLSPGHRQYRRRLYPHHRQRHTE